MGNQPPASTRPLDRLRRDTARALGRGWRRVALAIVLVLSAALAWAYVAEINQVAIAHGEVVPQGQVKVIQHLEGGLIVRIDVSEGDVVRQGEPLLLLDLGVAGANVEELQVQLDALVLQRARLGAEAQKREPTFPRDIAERRPDFVASEMEIFRARRQEHESTLSVLRQQIAQREAEVAELRAQHESLKAELGIAFQLLAMSDELMEKGLTSEAEHLLHRREVGRLRGEITRIESAIPRVEAALEEARARLSEEQQKFQRTVLEELADVEVDIARTRELIKRADEQKLRQEIRSPIDGVVKNLRYHTIGGVVRSGEPIMEIVPLKDSLVVEAKLDPVDRGFVREGQPVVVKVSAYDFVRYGGLSGRVETIAADTSSSAEGVPFFKVVVRTENADLGTPEDPLPITPGMQAQVDIHTGSRTVVDYLVRPVLKLRNEAFIER